MCCCDIGMVYTLVRDAEYRVEASLAAFVVVSACCRRYGGG